MCYYAPLLARPHMTNLVVMPKETMFKIIFLNQGQVYEIYARQVYQSDLWGFLEVEEFVFGERTQVIVDPGEEKLKNEFSTVRRSFIPMHSIIRIDEVDKEGACKVSDAKGSNIAQFPYPPMAPKPGPGKE